MYIVGGVLKTLCSDVIDRDENEEMQKTAEKVCELAREAKPTERGKGVGGGLAPLPR